MEVKYIWMVWYCASWVHHGFGHKKSSYIGYNLALSLKSSYSLQMEMGKWRSSMWKNWVVAYDKKAVVTEILPTMISHCWILPISLESSKFADVPAFLSRLFELSHSLMQLYLIYPGLLIHQMLAYMRRLEQEYQILFRGTTILSLWAPLL